jgi:integrase
MGATKQSRTSHPADNARSLDDAIGEYLDESAARTRARTLEIYETVLRRHLLPWATSQGLERAEELDQRAVSRWVVHLRTTYRTAKGDPLSEASVRTYARTANSFLKWLDQPARAQAPAARRRTLDVLSRAEIDKLESAAVTERDRLLIRVLADTGCRLGEALGLREQDVMQQERREHALRLGGKTGQRLAPISAGLYRRLRKYIEHGRPEDYHGDHIFVGLHSVKGGRYQVPGRGTIEAMVRESASRAGIRRRVYPHLLRHSALTHLLRKGVNPILVAEVAGHASLEMIRSTYSHLTISDRHKAVMRALVDEDDSE